MEIKLTKQEVIEDGVKKLAKPLNMEDVSVLLFDVIKLKPEQMFGVALYTSRYDTKEAKFKPGGDTSPYLTKDSPIYFKDHEVTVTAQTANIMKVTFKNVPFNITDEELMHLCQCNG